MGPLLVSKDDLQHIDTSIDDLERFVTENGAAPAPQRESDIPSELDRALKEIQDGVERSENRHDFSDQDDFFGLDAMESGNAGGSGNAGDRDRDPSRPNSPLPSTSYGNYNGNTTSNNYSANEPKDPLLDTLTAEEAKRRHVARMLSGMESSNNDESEFLRQEDDEDEHIQVLEQIDMLYSSLKSEGINLDQIPLPADIKSKKDAVRILKILRIKNDRHRFVDLFEEGALIVAGVLEGIFDGKREYLGKTFNLTGYSDTMKIKLRRIRYDTSTFVGSIVRRNNSSPGLRILFELVPSLFLHSHNRRTSSNDSLSSDSAYKTAIQNMS